MPEPGVTADPFWKLKAGKMNESIGFGSGSFHVRMIVANGKSWHAQARALKWIREYLAQKEQWVRLPANPL
uniref:Uncharacterized protein n=1 Tax=mine drainage metagenome TaxID=410659 RepID=E6PYH2_9ZZZZ